MENKSEKLKNFNLTCKNETFMAAKCKACVEPRK